MLLPAGVLLLLIAAFPYLVFLLGIHIGRKDAAPPEPEEYPEISIVMAAYNEAAVIEERIANIRASDYPQEKYEVILVDDCSSDDTCTRAKRAFAEAGIEYRILQNTDRMGTNRSINRAIGEASHSILVTTGADVFFDTAALKRLIARLMSEDNIAAACGDLRPKPAGSSRTSIMEGAYRNYYGRMCCWESAVDSTYNFNGGLVAFKKHLVSRIDDRRGADDANTAFEAIRRGYRAVYETAAVVYEDIPGDFGSQYRQKARRATHLIEATLGNLDLLKTNRQFSRFFYPLRIWMYLATPAFFLVGSIVMLAGLFVVSPLLASAALAAFAAAGFFKG
ncbi:MAG: glycosyltransferase, partial [Methanomicrobiaceae archaeon]|nr:glycosyltransferase [Methanomicrobiaceae archaeon]